MKEDFLYYLWQYQQFLKTDLRTTAGEEIKVLKTGHQNLDAGPDFALAKVQIANVEWAGSVEMHLRASDWNRHNHQTDPKYGNVILHVVWENDEVVLRHDNTPMPTLELKNLAFPEATKAYQILLQQKPGIPCAPFFPEVPELTKISMLGRTLHERLTQKIQELEQLLQHENGDWENTTYRWLFRAFGFRINTEPMLRLSAAVSWQILRKHLDSLLQVEALLFGQAGLLDVEPENDLYLKRLQQEYLHLAKKYALQPNKLQKSHWNFFRLRPANFPTVRLAQLAVFLHKTPFLRQSLIETEDVNSYFRMFKVQQTEYWQQHYLPLKASKSKVAGLGKSSVYNLLINSVVPLLYAYGKYKGDDAYINKSLALLDTVPPEENTITSIYHELGFPPKTAADSQALIQLNKFYCQPVRCLNCAIGVKIMRG